MEGVGGYGIANGKTPFKEEVREGRRMERLRWAGEGVGAGGTEKNSKESQSCDCG